MNRTNSKRFKQWELFISTRDPDVLDPLLAEDIKFSSPFTLTTSNRKAI
jgi:hypothetical protein